MLYLFEGFELILNSLQWWSSSKVMETGGKIQIEFVLLFKSVGKSTPILLHRKLINLVTFQYFSHQFVCSLQRVS